MPITPKPNTIVIIAGPSLTGKSNLSAALVEQGFAQLVSTTTRAPRNQEEDGVHYHFVTKDDFRKKLSQRGFIEHVEVDSRLEKQADGTYVKTEGNLYGMSRDEVVKAFSTRKPVVVVCEPNGVRAMHEYATAEGWNPVRVFLNNTPELLVKRFLERYKEDAKADSENYATRLVRMVSFEQQNWVEPAMSGKEPYDVLYPKFEEGNQIDVVRDLVDRVGLAYKAKRAPGM